MDRTKIKFGQVWIAIKDYEISQSYSPQFGCTIPKGTRVVVLGTPRIEEQYTQFSVMPLTSKGLDSKLVPNLKRMEREKEGFGVNVAIDWFDRYFALDSDQKIEFDNQDAKEFWDMIVRGHRTV